jgi:hypothetical protein
MKHLKDYKQYIVEQALPPAPGMPGDPNAPGAAPAPAKEYLFTFVGDKADDGIRRRKYPDGSVIVEYETFATTEKELEDWVKSNIISTEKQKHTDSDLEIKKENLINIVKGHKINISDSDLTFIEKLKNAVTTDVFGKKHTPIEVVFAHDGEPTTNAINVTFIRLKK